MGRPAYLVTNRLSEAALTPSSVDPVYGVTAYLHDGRQNKPFRFNSNAVTLLMDFGAAVTLSIIGIVKHNITDAPTNFTLDAGATSACADFSLPLTYYPQNVYSLFLEHYRYWRLWINNPANPDNIEIGELYIGNYQGFSRGISFGAIHDKDFVNDKAVTEFGTITAYEKYAQRAYNFPAGNILDAFANEIEELYNLTKGDLTPLFFVPDLDEPLAIFGRLDARFSKTQSTKSGTDFVWQSGIRIREESPGAVVL